MRISILILTVFAAAMVAADAEAGPRQPEAGKAEGPGMQKIAPGEPVAEVH